MNTLDDLKKLSQEEMVNVLRKASEVLAESRRDTEILSHVLMYILEKDYNGKKLISIREIQAVFNDSRKLLLMPEGENMEITVIPSKEKLQ
jgi:hypothetical protein